MSNHYIFNEAGSIPGVPGTFSGVQVDIDDDGALRVTPLTQHPSYEPATEPLPVTTVEQPPPEASEPLVEAPIEQPVEQFLQPTALPITSESEAVTMPTSPATDDTTDHHLLLGASVTQPEHTGEQGD